MRFQHKFVDFIPDIIEEGILYISLDYGTVIHKCACGCGSEVNTPLAPTGWKMIYNGEAISLKPSVGNWSFDCKSHYWITKNEVEWSLKWSDKTIREVRAIEYSEREEYYNNKNVEKLDDNLCDVTEKIGAKPTKKKWFQKLLFWK